MFFFFGEKDAGEFIISEMKALRDEGVVSMRVDIVLARAYMNVEKFAEAEAVLAKVAEAHPDEKYPHLYLSTVYDELDRFRDAERHLKRCPRIESKTRRRWTTSRICMRSATCGSMRPKRF